MGKRIDNIDIEDYYNAELISRTYPEVCSIENPRDNSVTFANNLSDLKKLENIDKRLFVLVPDIKEINKYYKSKKLGSNITISFCRDVNHAFVTIFNKLDKKIGESVMEEKKVERMGMDNGRFGLEDKDVATKLLDKNFSPMIIRKYTRLGFPLYVHIICDENLSDLDSIVHDCIDFCREKKILENNIQSLRNFTGVMSEWINNHYDSKKRGCVESLGIVFYADKMIISSLQGDCMNHDSCRRELYECLNLMAKI